MNKLEHKKKFRFWSGNNISKPKEIHKNCILIATSNPEGRHGMGLANTAHRFWGAEYYVGRGLSGQSYLLFTKNLTKNYFEVTRSIPTKNFILAYKRDD